MSEKPVTTVRFTASQVALARGLADRDGMSVSAWIRRLIEREISRREGKCPSCGQAVAP